MNNKEKGKKSIVLGTAIIIVAMTIAFFAMYAWMYSKDMLFLPDFIKDILKIEDQKKNPWSLGELSEIVKTGKDEQGNTISFDVTYENLRSALILTEDEEGLYMTSQISFYDNNGDAKTSRIFYWKYGDNFRAEIYGTSDIDNTPETLKIGNKDLLYVYDYKSSESNIINRAADFSAENEAGIPSLDELMTVIEAFPKDEKSDIGQMPDGSYIEDCVLKLINHNDENLYYVSFVYSDLGIKEEYYLSLEHKMVVLAKTTFEDKPIYSYETTYFSNNPAEYNNNILYLVSKAAEE